MWNLDPTKILTRRNLAAVLRDGHEQAKRSANSGRNLIIVVLAC